MRHLQQLLFIDAVARTGSIRRAAQSLAITSTALNRRILSVEEDLGAPIFERTGKGVRLSVAGEIFIHHARQQLSDIERVKSQIADLSGERRGRVSIACGQALMQEFLPNQIARYRAEHPGVDFSVSVCGRDEATDRLLDFSADFAIVYEPDVNADISVLLKVPQDIYAVMSRNHPLASKNKLHLSECAQFPLALPSRRSGLRTVIEKAAIHHSIDLWAALESDSLEFLIKVLDDNRSLGFLVSATNTSVSLQADLRAVRICTRDLAQSSMVVLQQKGRTLPVAAARFMTQVLEELSRAAVASPEVNAQLVV
jgi:DNA-binding transcriptional LysR family regulator